MRTLPLALLLTGCVAMPAGGTISVLAASPAGLTLQYTHWTVGETQAAIALASQHCAAYGKQMQVGPSQQAGFSPDKIVVNYNCV